MVESGLVVTLIRADRPGSRGVNRSVLCTLFMAGMMLGRIEELCLASLPALVSSMLY